MASMRYSEVRDCESDDVGFRRVDAGSKSQSVRTPRKSLPSVVRSPSDVGNKSVVAVPTDHEFSGKSSSLPASARSLSCRLLSLPAEALASQITLLDLPVFCAINPDELTTCGWTKRNKLTISPNVVAFTRRFNHVSFWAVQEILQEGSVKGRAEVLAHVIRVAKKLHELNNLHSLFAIVSALQSASIYRLTKTWGQLSKKDRQTFDKLAELFQDKDNWQRLRQHIDTLRLPCIPYLGLYLTDLVYIDMAHPSRPGIEPEPRRAKMNNILRVISAFQESRYPQLQPQPLITHYLTSIRYIDELQKFVEDDQYKLSLCLEPPTPTTSKESMSETCMTVASLSLSPAKGPACSGSMRLHAALHPSGKFVPCHRKSRSLGSNIFNKCVQVTPSEELPAPATSRHLLDDSVLEVDDIICRDNYLVNEPEAFLRRGSLLSDECDDFPTEPLECVYQGCLRRKTVSKGGRRPPVSTWQRYWVQVRGSSMVYFAAKGFKGSERNDFKREPCKVHGILGLDVAVLSTGSPPQMFQLSDPSKGNVYKFRTGSEQLTLNWCSLLHQISSGLDEKPLPTNLMTFE